jgi:hypothetical protein
MTHFLTTLPPSIWFWIGILGLLSPVSLTAAPKPETTIWQLTRTDQIGGLVPEIMGAPKPRSEPVLALSFNGKSDGLLVPVNPLAGCAKFTVEIFISPESGGCEEQRFFHAEDTTEARALLELRVLPDGKWCLDSFLRAGKTSRVLLDRSKAHPPDRWHWVAMSYDGETLTSFVNGVRELSGKVSFPVMKEGRVSLGVRQNKVSWFKGAIREVRFHSTALTADQLQSVVPAE